MKAVVFYNLMVDNENKWIPEKFFTSILCSQYLYCTKLFCPGLICSYFYSLAPPRDGDVTLIYTRPDENHINLTCSARGVFPKPVVTLSWGRRYLQIILSQTLLFYNSNECLIFLRNCSWSILIFPGITSGAKQQL